MATESNAPVLLGELVERPFVSITWQKGLPGEAGFNGCRVDDVLLVVEEKLQAYQDGPLACPENEAALKGVHAALASLAARRQRRIEQGVLNTMAAHETERTEDVEQDFSATGA